jgi:hypothetical protein
MGGDGGAKEDERGGEEGSRGERGKKEREECGLYQMLAGKRAPKSVLPSFLPPLPPLPLHSFLPSFSPSLCGSSRQRQTYNNGPINSTLQLPRGMPLLLAWLALLHFGCLACRWQAHCHIGYLEHCKWPKNSNEGRHGVCHNGIESVRIHRKYSKRMHVCIETSRIILERLNGRCRAGLWL